MAFETDLIRRYSGAFSKEDCTRIIEGIHFFEKNHLLYYDKEKLAREDHKTVNITHEYDFSASSRLAEQIFPRSFDNLVLQNSLFKDLQEDPILIRSILPPLESNR